VSHSAAGRVHRPEDNSSSSIQPEPVQPVPQAMTQGQRKELARQAAQIVGEGAVLWRPEDLMLYEYDGLSTQGKPDLVVFPSTTQHVSAVVKLANIHHLPVIARGAGTGLSGGAVVPSGGIVLGFSRMKKILAIDVENQRARVQPGVVNLDLSLAVADLGYYFAPDPSSQKACTLGGNVAENSGGPHTLAYGVTTNHVLGLELVLPSGEVIRTGSPYWDPPGYDLTGLFVGSEGTLAIVTEIIVRLMPKSEAVKTLLAIYDRVHDATSTVAAITAQGITPAALEMLDGFTLRAIEEATHAGYPLDSAAVLLIELEGLREAVEEESAQVEAVCRSHGVRHIRVAQNAAERDKLWQGRKNAFGAMGRISPNYYVQDGVIPRTRLPEMLDFIDEVGRRYGLRIGNIFHAGDGNLHPLIMFDARDAAQSARVLEAASEIMMECAAMGGSITGEHGVGIEKSELMPLIFSAGDLDLMRTIKAIFNPADSFNPGKVLPTGKMCGELRIQITEGVPRG
jgi:glycolate oxidase